MFSNCAFSPTTSEKLLEQKGLELEKVVCLPFQGTTFLGVFYTTSLGCWLAMMSLQS
jgi:hypothetical protein